MRPMPVAGDGAPWVEESAVAGFALAVGLKHGQDSYVWLP